MKDCLSPGHPLETPPGEIPDRHVVVKGITRVPHVEREKPILAREPSRRVVVGLDLDGSEYAVAVHPKEIAQPPTAGSCLS